MNLTKMLACQFVINWVWCPHDNWTTTSALDFLSTARCWSSIHLYINSLYGLKVFDESVFFFVRQNQNTAQALKKAQSPLGMLQESIVTSDQAWPLACASIFKLTEQSW